MAVGSFDQDTLEQVVAAAVDAGLADPARRGQLLAHLPERFVEKIEPADDPVAQLKADVDHLNAHPRLPDHHQPPMASWLQNAYLLTTPSPQARVFRELRGRLVGSGRQQEILRSITRIKRMTSPDDRRRPLDDERPREPRAGTRLGGRFVLDKQLGRGAVATVWRADDLATGVQVAVKILHRRWSDNPERRERFFAGARQMAQFAHPHIVPVVLPEGRDGGQCFCVLEYLDAGDLESALREGRIRRSAALRALLKVAAGVAAMHAAGVMHLDLKPQNILLGTDGRVMLGDFDRVRNAATEGGSTTDTVESIFYLAPETFDETTRPGPTADVFSLGMTALFVLHGDKLPAWIVRRPAALLRRIDCPEALRQVIGRAIELEPAARQTDIESLAIAMQEALGRSPTGSLMRVAPIVSAGPAAISPPGAASAPGAGPMPRVSAPPRVNRNTGELPPVATLTGELPDVRESGAFRALSRSGAMPAMSAAEAFDVEAASVGGSLDRGRATGELPPPSLPPASLPPPPLDLPPAGTGELELDDSIDSALEVLDRAAAAALAEEFARKESGASEPGHDSALLPAPDPPPVEPITDSIDLDGPVDPLYESGAHASIPGDENRSPWQWVEKSGGFIVADDPDPSDEHSMSESSLGPIDHEPSRPPWHWGRSQRPGAPDPVAASVRALATEPGESSERFHIEASHDGPLPDDPADDSADDPADDSADDSADARDDDAPRGALPLDLPAEDLEPSVDEITAEEAFLPPPPDLAELMTEHLDRRPRSSVRQAEIDRAIEEASTTPVAPAPPPVEHPPAPQPTPPPPRLEPPPPDRRTWLAVAGLGALGAGVTWWLTRSGPVEPVVLPAPETLPEVPRPAMAARAPDAAAPPADAEMVVAVDAEVGAAPDAEMVVAVDAEVDATIDAARPSDAARPPDAAPPPRRRRRRRRKARGRARPKPKPTPAPEPLIEIPDEIQQMLDE